MLPQAPFQITEAAKNRILAAMDEYEQLKGRPAIPALLWIDAALNNHMFPSHIGIGLYDVRADIEDGLYQIGDMELGIAMTDEDFARLQGKVVDYDKRQGLHVA